MARALVASLVVGALFSLAPGRPAAADSVDLDFATYDARVLDKKGISTDVREFGYITGQNVLMAYRGDADVEIPWRLIRSLELSDFVAETRRSKVTATMRSGKVYALEIDAIEEGRLLRGKADFGEYRIRMGKVRRLDLMGFSTAGTD